MSTYLRYGVLLILSVFCSCKENLVKLKSEQDANNVLLGLRESSIEAEKVPEASEWIIKVPQKMFTESLRVLQAKRLLEKVQVVKHPDSQIDLFASKDQIAKEYLQSIAREVSESLHMFPGILDSRIHIFKETEKRDADTISSGASVVLLTDRGVLVDVETIRLLVSKASGVPAESVAVIVNPTQATVSAPKSSSEQSETPISSVSELPVETVHSGEKSSHSFASTFVAYGSTIKIILSCIAIFICMCLCGLYLYFRYSSRKEINFLQSIGV